MRESRLSGCVSSEGWHDQAGDKPAGVKVVWMAEVMETETLKPIDKVSLGEATSHRAVTKVNALWPRK